MKSKFTLLTLLVFLITAIPSFAQSGKIVGKVTDLETGESLIGANILINGTNLGAATNVDGEYIILNVPPNTYTLVARYIGYKEVTKLNIQVSVNVTTEVNFQLPSQAYELGTVEIIAPKPLINKNLTNSVNIVRSEDIENLPVRGVNAIVSTQTGVVNQGGTIYVRGGRQDAVAYYVDGVLVNNPVFGGAQTAPINNAIQEVQFQAGGYPAEYGGANAGIISTTTKIGGEKYHFSMEGITDEFTSAGEKFIDTYSYGYSEYILTGSGPIFPSLKNIRFFVAGDYTWHKTPIAFYEGADFNNVFDPALGENADTINYIYPAGYRLNQGNRQVQVQGNLSFDFNPFTIKLNGSFKRTDSRNGVGVTQFLTASRAGEHQDQTITSSMKITQVLSDRAYYDVIFNYFGDYYVDMDPIFEHNITAYGDSVMNAQVGTTLRGDGQLPTSLRAYGFTFTNGVIPWNGYRKQRTTSLGGKIGLLYQIGLHHELKTGADLNYYTIRRYSLPNPITIASFRRALPQGTGYDFYDRLDNYGYDAYGNKLSGGINGPKHPIFAAYYIQDKMEFSDLVVNFGLRLDYIDTDSKAFKNPNNIKFVNNLVDPNDLVDVDPFTQVSPRLGFSFPVTDKTVFHAQYGKFIQQSQLRDIYEGYNVVADNIQGGYAIQQPVGFGLKPERSTQYEIGFKQQLGDVFAFDITGFYKDIKDQIQERSIYAEPGANHRQYYAFVNGDFSTVKGIELKFDLRRVERISATLDYTYSDAQGTGSNPSSSFRQIWQSPTAIPYFPQQIAPLDFNQAHTGALNIDYRFADNDGPSLFGSQILSNFGINALFRFTSGFNFTRYTEDSFGNSRVPTEPLNASTTPWTFQLDMKIDKSVSFGPFDANIYLWVINVLNTQNVVDVFPVSGDAYDDGWLSSPQGSQTVSGIASQYGQQYADMYEQLYSTINYDSGHFGPPRQIRLGVRLNY
jgi:outer membrane receptor protein involved in Fe transport